MADVAFQPPPIPVYLAHLPTVGGLVVPVITPRHRNGMAAFGLVDRGRMDTCLREQRCGVCGRVMQGRMVFLLRQADLIRKCSVEPGLCPPCAAYTQAACPMVAGRMQHYRRTAPPFISRRCDDAACGCRAWTSQPEPARHGAPAEPWYALWTRQYELMRDDKGNLVAGFAGLRVLVLREVKHRP